MSKMSSWEQKIIPLKVYTLISIFRWIEQCHDKPVSITKNPETGKNNEPYLIDRLENIAFGESELVEFEDYISEYVQTIIEYNAIEAIISRKTGQSINVKGLFSSEGEEIKSDNVIPFPFRHGLKIIK